MEAPPPGFVRIRYRRPPDREQVYLQRLVHRGDDVHVTLLERTPLAAPVSIEGRIVLEPGAPVVWFTFRGARHDIGRFHTAAGRFTGLYADILTPVRFLGPDAWETTDLFLDVWLWPGGEITVLDEDELETAVARGWVGATVAAEARAEAARLVEEAAAGRWPPPVVHDWTLERVREELARS